MRGKSVRRGRGRRRVGRRNAGIRRKVNRLTKGEFASCKETRDLGYVSNGVPYKFSEFAIGGWDRAGLIAQAYQYYRITKVEIKFMPTADTYISGSPGEIPNLYYMIDKTDSIQGSGFNVETLISMGAKPVRFDDKTLTVPFKPAVVWKALDENGGGSNFGMSKISPWLATNDNNTSDTQPFMLSSVDHHGIAWFVTGGVAGQNYRVEVTAHFQFKKPLWYTIPSADAVPTVNLGKKLMDKPVPPVE